MAPEQGCGARGNTSRRVAAGGSARPTNAEAGAQVSADPRQGQVLIQAEARSAAKNTVQRDGIATTDLDANDLADYWRKLDQLRPHRTFAMRYIQTLDKFLTRTHQEISTTTDQPKSEQLKKKRKVAENVRKYLWLLCRLCTDNQNKKSGLPPNMRLLEVIQKTLDAVYKRQRMPDAKHHNEELHARRQAVQQTNTATPRSSEPGLQKQRQYTAGRALVNPRPNALKLAYDDTTLSWNAEHTANTQEMYCYCGTNKQEACLQCTVCKNWFHKGCTSVLKSDSRWVDFMLNYRFTCKICNAHDNRERFELTKCSWLESILGGFHHLMATTVRRVCCYALICVLIF